MRFWVARALAAGWLVVLVVGSIAPADTEQIQPAYVFGDFVLHAFGYFGLTVLLVFSQRQPRIWISAIVAMVIGIALEGVQGLTPDRAMQASDALANTVGALTGAGFFWFRGCFRTSSPA
ncbi:VanZ family protein [Candidatus Nanopelagicales bacterium]|nr:VanZ family protein [Candidatus Nanopelagicales bacterium]